ncbi:MAG: 30S ribosomal protein S13 [Candidatus Wildermuthbacteria bacterium RIFCSPHIGHO2_01_FULL_48_25]|uniref:Small ribosomal subunit protein uS13 n=1 Tax=Candidatus Wildermuthbacteria bacterium RIFCSPLOWO2_01_FULL_48_16 TaxID=1802461 RepID=A0A1G2RN59_9BACT|nr:MAG: 30S ribosomal protein S13 [Candidatus Wildermuthbacteria bacterium RIFCSPHIGHO2_01_FULL_48_25]OHA68846.1 MAG: 30S ribosomal protein S13 [Candidatus Wildermuthbacteria bacterium RIFCSPHIGHO2_02_FULL_49_12b]OHA73451.1 MAG: 30S ribosomal protein S13 [Candidatus Wildermuthbacteria bacterium RIFCSPLOWO2_01_FULL_48_16]
MPRIAGTTIPDNKNIVISLTYIFGIGPALSLKIIEKAKVDPKVRASALKAEELNRIKDIIEKEYRVEGELKRDILANVKRLRDIGTWRGMRHMKKLPVRGQRTKTNMRTVKGNVRKTMGSGRKPAASPT